MASLNFIGHPVHFYSVFSVSDGIINIFLEVKQLRRGDDRLRYVEEVRQAFHIIDDSKNPK